MILWTINRYEVWEIFQYEAVFRADPVYVDEWFRYPYSWYIRQMEKAIPRLPGAQTPIWAWCQYRGNKQPCPDLRHIRAGFPDGETGVRIALDVPDELVLLSDFEMWHYPLNWWYLPRSEEDEKLFEKELVAQGLSLPLPEDLPSPLRARMEKSWENIFDLAFYWEELNRPREEKSIQATLWEIRLEWVTKLEIFTSNGKVYKNRLG